MSDWLRHKLRKLLERLAGIFYEGPSTPRRFADEAKLFRVQRPHATSKEWASFAAKLAHNAYTQGFTRGYQWQERDWPGPAEDPETVAEREAANWGIADNDPALQRILELGYNPFDPLAGVTPQQLHTIRAAMRAGATVVDAFPDRE